MQKPIDSLDSADLRRWAIACYDQANDARASGEERARLLRMRESLLLLANEQDWLNGKKKNPSNERQGFAFARSTA
jgi:hypothetical protein